MLRALVTILRYIFAGLIYLVIGDISICYKMDYTNFLNEPFRDYFSPNKEEEIMVVSTNINGLKTKGWKAKNDM